jgi:hypothetical protein
LSVYHFLCDLQAQESCTSLGFLWGPLENETTFLPRVSCNNFLLSPATWNLRKWQYELLLKAGNESERSMAVKRLQDVYRIPNTVLLCEADNELWLDLQNPVCLKLLIRELRDNENIQLREYLPASILKGEAGSYQNEFIFFAYKDTDGNR